jgi:hypothetical protein
MTIDLRLLRAQFLFDEGRNTVEYNEDFSISFSASKNVFSTQNYARLEIKNVRREARSNMMTRFNQFNQRTQQTPFLPVNILSGRESYGPSLVYTGNVIKCGMSTPPDIGLIMDLATNQIDKTKWVQYWPKPPITYKSLCLWAADILGLTPEINLPDKLANAPVTNFIGGNMISLEALPIYIQRYYPDQIVAFVDDGALVVSAIGSVVASRGTVEVGYGTLSPFIGIPEWTEFGIQGKILFIPSLKLGCAVNATSIMNPSINGEYVVGKIDYELASRDAPFYSTFTAYPRARTA